MLHIMWNNTVSFEQVPPWCWESGTSNTRVLQRWLLQIKFSCTSKLHVLRVSHVTLACHQRSASLFRRSWPYSSWRQDQLGWGAWAVSFRTIGCWKHTMVVLHQYDLHDFFLYTYIHTCIHTYIHTYMNTWSYIHYIHDHTCIHTYMHRKCGAAQVPHA